jgi:hypothetical protein
MTYRPTLAKTCTAISLLWGVACDKPVETVEETPAAAPAQAQASLAADTRLDLEAVITRVSSGEVTSAAELEAELEVDAVAKVDIDLDGKKDELRIVERRAEKVTVFEVRAIPSSKVDVDIEAAPVIAQIEFEAKADAGTAVARASYSASFAASAKLDASATFEHTYTGVVVTAEGRMHVEADANVFVAWAFRAGRPMYVAEVFVLHEVEPEPDPCWPPGHCKHGFWKATGELPPGHEKRRDDDPTFARGHKEIGKPGPMDDHVDKHDGHDDHGKDTGKDKSKADAKPSASKGDKGSSKGADKGDKGSSKGADKGGKGGKRK